ncbi:2OG-Fe(II) oxygenase family protein [uncultured Roseovarius sp.]|uniref:isopenicillin N synthase family dioxygenase n=1 Tax=uncultured Roseovarius sp. TaxID=293344 RepID=UPI00262B86CE|nr:2OG-Fe(II) oxygenase family protein [uncultured Roseovarius sp.]
MTEFTEIPVIDVNAIHGDDEQAKRCLATRFADTYGTTGFGYIKNHGVPKDLIDRVFQASARFHALPARAKMAVELNGQHRGFIPINTSTDINSKLADVRKPNQSESFMIMREDGPDSPDVQAGAYLAGPNQWPDLEGFKADVMAYHDAMAGLGRRLMDIAARAIGVDPDEVAPAFERPTTWLRLLYYPPANPMDDDDVFGSAPHTDFGCLTILAQDDIGGLQVQTPAGKWIDAPRIPGTFVVNVGDMLHRWSNGRLLSTPHRVINLSGKSRYSCPFFFDPNVATTIVPFASCVSEENPSRFEPTVFGEFLKQELEAGYDKHKKAP